MSIAKSSTYIRRSIRKCKNFAATILFVDDLVDPLIILVIITTTFFNYGSGFFPLSLSQLFCNYNASFFHGSILVYVVAAASCEIFHSIAKVYDLALSILYLRS